MPEQRPFNVHEYLDIALRRKWYIIIPLVVCVMGSFAIYKTMPKIYSATTLILVQAQRIPESYVRSTITDSVGDRLNTISQEILSRTRLEKVIEEFNLYSELRNTQHMEEVVEMMRKDIQVRVQRAGTQNTFSVSYEGREPRTVMSVTNKLASLFIEENLRVRETRVEDASAFLARELQEVEDQLKKKENDVRVFKERNLGQLPTQLDANLRILERLQQQLQSTSENLRSAEDRSVNLQNQIEQQKDRLYAHRETPLSVQPRESERNQAPREGGQVEPVTEHSVIAQMNNLKQELAAAQSKYKENHPDVTSLKRKIATLEPKVKEFLETQESERKNRLREMAVRREGNISERHLPAPVFVPDPATERLITQYTVQLNDVRSDIKRLREEGKHLREQLVIYQRRIEETPKREQEMVFLTRDYDLLRTNYQSLLEKRMQAQMAENLERRQQGEQFKILDPGRLPESPIRPDRNKILLMGALIGLGLGLGLTFGREYLDQSFKTVAEVETELGFKVLATIPNLIEDKKAA